jgi:hypothetical protein
MTIPPPDIEHGADRGPGTPGWVKALGVVVIVLVLVALVLMLTGIGGEHAPGRHG